MDIVFAHFNSPIPKHLLLNLHRTSVLFPRNQVILITDLDLNKNPIKNVSIYRYTPSKKWMALDDNLKHSKNFRNNFWFTSVARFIALADFSAQTKREFLHVESDVILAEDFPFEKLSTIGSDFIFPIVSDTNAIASCLYLRDFKSAEHLSNFTLAQSSENNLTTDMYILSELSSDTSMKFTPLPTAPSAYYSETKSNQNFLQKSDISLDYFGGVFDGRDLGCYLFGDDPRNKRGISILRENDSWTYLNVRNLDLVTKPDREFPYIYHSALDSYIPIYSLHVHSKNLGLFKIKKGKELIRGYVSQSKNKPMKVFVFSIFVKSIINSLKRRMTSLADSI